jgi:uncharacterized damage-inducible protein DinB
LTPQGRGAKRCLRRKEDDMNLIEPGYVRTMAAYNAAMNKRLYDAAARLPDAERRRDRGAFFHSLVGTLNHLLWADHVWMARFDGWEKPTVLQKDSASLFANFDALRTAREDADRRIIDWASRVSADWTNGPLTWHSNTTNAEMTLPAGYAVMHFFNHQTHHRGQAHALVTAAGEDTGGTDLLGMVPPIS